MGAYLLSLVESFAVTVGQVHGPGHHAWAGFELLQGRLHVSAAGALCEDGGIGGMRGVAGPRWTPPRGAERGAGVWGIKCLRGKSPPFVPIRCYQRSFLSLTSHVPWVYKVRKRCVLTRCRSALPRLCVPHQPP